FLETIIDERRDDFAEDALAPEFFAKPITEFGSVSMHVFTEMKTNSADRHAADLDAEIHRRLFGNYAFQKIVRVLDRVGIWKPVPQIDRNPAIVCVFCHRFGVFHAPVADRAAIKLEFHVYFSSSFVSANVLTANSKSSRECAALT